MRKLLVISLLLAAAPAAAQQTRCDNNARPRPDLGISLACENCSVGDYNRPSSWSFSKEPRVSAVASGGAADGALQAGDEIVRVNGYTITSSQGAAALATPEIGKPMVLTVRRDGSLRAVAVTPVANCPEAIRSTAIVSGASPTLTALRASQVSPSTGWLGIAFDCSDCSVQQTRPGQAEWQFSEPPRIYSVETNSPAYRAGLRRGDYVIQVNGMNITEQEAGRRFGSLRPGESVRIGYRRGSQTGTVAIRVGTNPTRVNAVAAARNTEQEVRQLIEQQQRVEERARELVSEPNQRLATELAQRLRSHAEESARQLNTLRSRLADENITSTRKREVEAQIVELRAATARHQQQLINELVVKQQEEARRLQELQRELSSSMGRVTLVAPSRAQGGSYIYSPSGQGGQVLRYSGTLGSSAIEVRGPTPVIVDQKGDTITITIGSSVVKVTQEKK